MKINKQGLLIGIAVVFASFLLGFFAGRNLLRPAVTTSRIAPTIQTLPESLPTTPETTVPETTAYPEPSYPININEASARDLAFLPGIGQTIAQRIVDYREANGPYGELTDLLNVEGIGEKRLEQMLPYITTGGSN